MESGSTEQFNNLLGLAAGHPVRALEILTSRGMMFTHVAGGYGIGLVLEEQAKSITHPDIVVRSLSGSPGQITYLLTPKGPMPPARSRFVDRARRTRAK
jgi:hypothetical protein